MKYHHQYHRIWPKRAYFTLRKELNGIIAREKNTNKKTLRSSILIQLFLALILCLAGIGATAWFARKSTQNAIKEIQKSIYPNEFLVSIDFMGEQNADSGLVPPGGPYNLSVEGDSIDLRLKVKNGSKYPTSNFPVSLLFDEESIKFNVEKYVRQLLMKG